MHGCRRYAPLVQGCSYGANAFKTLCYKEAAPTEFDKRDFGFKIYKKVDDYGRQGTAKTYVNDNEWSIMINGYWAGW